jgi:hypothetical protein
MTGEGNKLRQCNTLRLVGFEILMMVILSAFSSVANAEGILIYGWDERIVPAVPAAEKDSRYLGYFYKRFNVYFVPIWRYGGKYVL